MTDGKKTAEEWWDLEELNWAQVFVDLVTIGILKTREYYKDQALKNDSLELTDADCYAAFERVCDKVLGTQLGQDIEGVECSENDHKEARIAKKLMRPLRKGVSK